MKNNQKLESWLAILWTIGGIIFFFSAASGTFKGTEAIQTHITQGIFDICMLVCGFYWGNSVAKRSNEKDE